MKSNVRYVPTLKVVLVRGGLGRAGRSLSLSLHYHYHYLPTYLFFRSWGGAI